jgi:Ca2+/Na+ antiporter
VIGGTCLVGAVAAFKAHRYTSDISFICAALLVSWIFIQISIIGSVSWMQQAVIIAGLLIFGLAYFLKYARHHNIP